LHGHTPFWTAEQLEQLKELPHVHIDYISSFNRLRTEIAALLRRKERHFCALYPDNFDGLICHDRDNSLPNWVRQSTPLAELLFPAGV
jgi:hypothetical protein